MKTNLVREILEAEDIRDMFFVVDEAKEEYIVAKNPNDKLWYALGRIGKKEKKVYYMPVSKGYKSKADAEKYANDMPKVDADARGLVAGV